MVVQPAKYTLTQLYGQVAHSPLGWAKMLLGQNGMSLITNSVQHIATLHMENKHTYIHALKHV